MQLGRDFITTLNQIAEERNIDRDLIISSLEAALVSACKRHQGSSPDVEVHIDLDSGEIAINEVRTVVNDEKALSSQDTQITLKDAQALGFENVSVGDTVRISKDFSGFGRIAAQTARQVVIQHLKDAERQVIYTEFADKMGEMVPGVVFKAELDTDQVLVRLSDRTEAVLPKKERIPGESYYPGVKMKFYVLDVRKMTRGPRIIVSRTHPRLLRKLMELEIPEIKDGTLEIRDVVREAGVRAKVSLASMDANVDPIGACVGNAGARIKNISTELKGEKVDIIPWSSDPAVYIRNSLSPSQAAKVEIISETEHTAKVYVYPDQLSLAIGKAGQNVRLAARLTGWKIDISPIAAEKMPTLQDLFHDSPQ